MTDMLLLDERAQQPVRSDTLMCHSEALARVGSWRFNIHTQQVEWSKGMFRIHGIEWDDGDLPVVGPMGSIHPADKKAAEKAINDAIEHHESGTCEHRIVRADSKERVVLLYFEGQRNGDGELTHIVGTMQDVTEFKKIEEEQNLLESKVQQAQKLESLGVLAGGIAHDFNNLLMGILGNADLALMDLAPESPARQSILAIETAAKRAADLARQMLAYSGKGRFVIKRLDLKVLIDEMMHLLKTSIPKKVVLKYEFGDSVTPIEGDAAQIRQVVLNLVVNASEAMGAKSGAIVVRTGTTECDRNYLSEVYLDADLEPGLYSYIEISDTGTGMDRQTLSRIFDPFFTTKFTGRGLGLAAVLGIVRGHRAAIKVESEPNRGTAFKVLFPVSSNRASSIGPTPEFVAASQLVGKRILLVDDEETVRAVGKSMLARLGCDVVTAIDGKQALEYVKANSDTIDCVLLDLTMPNMDGEECYREIRRIRKDIVVVLSSGYNEQDLMDRFAGKGVAGFIQKPYKTATLKQKLLEAFGYDGF